MCVIAEISPLAVLKEIFNQATHAAAAGNGDVVGSPFCLKREVEGEAVGFVGADRAALAIGLGGGFCRCGLGLHGAACEYVIMTYFAEMSRKLRSGCKEKLQEIIFGV